MSNMKLIMENWRTSILSEKTRFEKETGQKFDVVGDLEQKVTEQPSEYAFTMISIPKIGINPKTNFNTPAGVYFYPLDKERFDQLLSDTLPFVSNNKYVGVVKLNWSDKSKWLIMNEKSNQPKEKVQQALEYFKQKNISEKKILAKAIFKGRKFWFTTTTDIKIFAIAYFGSKELTSDDEGTRFTITFRKALTDLGYIGVYDTGIKVVHPSEPTQVVCLDPSAYEKIDILETAIVRKNIDPEKRKETAIRHRQETKQKKQEEERNLKMFSFEEANKIPQDQRNFGYLDLSVTGGILIPSYSTFQTLIIMPDIIRDRSQYQEDDNEIRYQNVKVLINGNLRVKNTFRLEKIQDLQFSGDNIKVNGSMIIRDCNIQSLPNKIVVGGDLVISNCPNLKELPSDLKVYGDIQLDNVNKYNIPKTASVSGGIYSRHDNKDYKQSQQNLSFGAIKKRFDLKEAIIQEINNLINEE